MVESTEQAAERLEREAAAAKAEKVRSAWLVYSRYVAVGTEKDFLLK